MPATPQEDAINAPWWPELLAVKDRLSWSALSKRFGVGQYALRRALEQAGESKAALPPGRKPKGPPAGQEAAPIEHAPSDPLDRHRAQVGAMPDAEIAIRAGVSPEDVRAFRKEHGIKPFLRAPPGAPPIHRPAALPEPPPAPEPTPVPEPSPAPSGSPLDAFRDLLGQVADHVIALRAGVKLGVVGHYRRKLGVPAYVGFRFRKGEAPPKAAPAPVAPAETRPEHAPTRAGRKSALDAWRDVVGQVTDSEVAARAGVTVGAVTQYRKRHGIPSATAARAALPPRPAAAEVTGEPQPVPEQRKPAVPPLVVAQIEHALAAEEPAPSSPPMDLPLLATEPTVPAGLLAFRVVAVAGERRRRFIAVGADIREATDRAVRALDEVADGPWTVRSVRYLSEALG